MTPITLFPCQAQAFRHELRANEVAFGDKVLQHGSDAWEQSFTLRTQEHCAGAPHFQMIGLCCDTSRPAFVNQDTGDAMIPRRLNDGCLTGIQLGNEQRVGC